MERCVIVGAGQAACQTAASLVIKKYGGEILMVGEEPYIPYERPPLSKNFLAGDIPLEKTYLRSAGFYEKNAIGLTLKRVVARINRAQRCVITADGEQIAYDKLVLATGARPRKLQVAGATLKNIHYLRTLADVLAIQDNLGVGTPRTVVIVGGGYIGLEVAAVLRERGHTVTVIEADRRVMARSVAAEVSGFYHDLHRSAGVDLVLGESVDAFSGSHKVTGVTLASGKRYDADLVIVGIGVLPNVTLAENAGLAVEDGIVVDDKGATADTNIFAAGDAVRQYNAVLGKTLRLESVPNAVFQGKTIAAAITGSALPAPEVPWFWSNQYDVKLQIVGVPDRENDVVLRGDITRKKFSAWYLRDDRIIAVNAVNSPKDFVAAKKHIGQDLGICAETLRMRLQDCDFDVKTI